jgi:hypothetical protein
MVTAAGERIGGDNRLINAEVGRNESRGPHLLGQLDKLVLDRNVEL